MFSQNEEVRAEYKTLISLGIHIEFMKIQPDHAPSASPAWLLPEDILYSITMR